ncbi:phenoloxidase-activating factor 2-like [Agrilus planipennis]|uniref:Phenoloxidase-activating factor 2 n=1 Tax=Agrilus planipennis TaxID=224129 RepID=A0A1W4W7B2_AGRPL|nr:phenoloxidase-activating factor 2-like [Agrilus planipennis]XP_018319979.1 phenoloxidase-activating factor 2-like [Agrilus planipennis]XP_025831752.1 phenoloxidase-activating factor 2-like [Agrilus planipennis]XP_025831753.1 phenoloxidase-activating factor 2-like [Agrilus planipennis]XP_025831754.1 phenoloxidase-activating factor 2-like [Agrilus planipennis]XP_025831755.1 phenoloxidase-activating factor 2-like [Agrilus planipennis]
MFSKVILLSLFFILDVLAQEPLYLAENIIDELSSLPSTENSQACLCVPYWQCKDDFSGLLDDEADLIDVRFLKESPENGTSCSGDFDVCCKLECGRSNRDLRFRSIRKQNKRLDFRILGDNNDAEFGEFPWMLGILEQRVYRCGASLIHPQVALTAAHCVSPNKKYKIRAGEWNWESQSEPLPHQDRWSAKIIVHPQYNNRSLKNDIALIITDTPFKIGQNVGIICLPQSVTNYDPENCIASGWGKNSVQKGSYQSTLKKVQLPIVNSIECTEKLRNARLGPYFNLHKSFICAGGYANKDTCKGDGGGPLICATKGATDRYQQVGIVSWGLTCGLKNTPGVYTNVGLFVEWIDSQMGRNNFDSTVYKL